MIAFQGSLRQRALAHLPVIVAAVFGLYSLVLLSYSVYSWRRMISDTDIYLLADHQRRASALSDLVTSLQEEMQSHAESHEIRTFLINRDLGMSMRYGLLANLQDIEDRFRRNIESMQRRRQGYFSRIQYRDENGTVLVDTGPDAPLPGSFPDFPGKRALWLDADGMRVLGAIRVEHRGSPGGLIITVSPAAVLYRNLLTLEAGTGREFLLGLDGREFIAAGTPKVNPQLGKRLIGLSEHDVVKAGAMAGSITAEETALVQGSLILNARVSGLPLKLVTLLPEERAYGHIVPVAALVVAGMIPLLLLYGAFRLDKMRRTAERMHADIELARAQARHVEARNIELSREIERRVAVEHALAASEERWELANRGANDGIWDFNAVTGEVYYSDRWKRILGYEPDELGNDLDVWRSRIHPDDVERIETEQARHLRGETEFYQCEYRMRAKDGRYVWILARGKASFDDFGRLTRIAGSHTDITARREADSRAQERTEQINGIFELSPDGFVCFNAMGRLSMVNPAFLAMTGLGAGEMDGLDEAEFSRRLSGLCVPDACFRGVAAMRQSPLAPGRRELIELSGPGQRVVEVGLRQGGHQVSEVLYFRDVTSETVVDRMKSEFLSTAAHELRTPMATIYGYAEVLQAFEFEADERNSYLGSIFRQAQLMASIINELLDLARIEARRGKDFDLRVLDIVALALGVARDYKPPGGRDIPAIELQVDALPVRADSGKMRQVIGNVLSNAYKYSPGGGPVTLNFIRDGILGGQWFGVRIRDRGIGMTPAETARVCERFYRADTSGKIPGTGLGMSIVKEIMELHGGRVEIVSVPGVGTEVTLWLPAAEDRNDGRPPLPVDGEVAAAQGLPT